MKEAFSKISTGPELRSLYKEPSARALKKSLKALDPHAKNLIAKSPFVLISTSDLEGNLDASPRGGIPGFVKVLDDNTLLIPDSKGNNRLDSLTNIVVTGGFASLFLIPGMDETLRLNGSAFISDDPRLLSRFTEEKNLTCTCIVVKVEEVFIHCAKALMRSKLWDSSAQVERSSLPTIGEIMKDQTGLHGRNETQEEMIERYKKEL